MSSRFDPNFTVPSGRSGGGSGSNTAVIVLTVSVIVLIVMVLISVMCNMCCPDTSSSHNHTAASSSMGARLSTVFKKKDKSKSKAKAKHSRPIQMRAAASPAARRAANNNAASASAIRPRRYVAARAAQAPQAARAPQAAHVAAPLPAAPLMAATDMPVSGSALHMAVSASNSIGDSEMSHSTTESGGSSANPFETMSYSMDSGMLTPSSATDITGLETFMPAMGDGVGKSDGPVDPSTGLPLFTTGKLVRSQMLGGHGAGSFLRQQQDPLSGYKRLGKNMCGSQNARRGLEVRRAQFNEARLADPNGDPVLFQTSEFAYQ